MPRIPDSAVNCLVPGFRPRVLREEPESATSTEQEAADHEDTDEAAEHEGGDTSRDVAD